MSDDRTVFPLLGQRVYAKAEGDERWTKGIVTDAFVAPVSQRIVYVVNGTGYYREEVMTAEDVSALPKAAKRRTLRSVSSESHSQRV